RVKWVIVEAVYCSFAEVKTTSANAWAYIFFIGLSDLILKTITCPIRIEHFVSLYNSHVSSSLIFFRITKKPGRYGYYPVSTQVKGQVQGRNYKAAIKSASRSSINPVTSPVLQHSRITSFRSPTTRPASGCGGMVTYAPFSSSHSAKPSKK